MITSKEILGKKLKEITLKDLEDFFKEEQEEANNLEFKSGNIQIDGIYKEICAFLNTDGGILIIGSPEEKQIRKNNKTIKRICQGELIHSNFMNSKWIIQKMASNIVPYPTDIKIKEILTATGNYFILEIPQSSNPPHQCKNDGRYYIRLDEQSLPAPHGIVEALFSKRQKPKLESEIEIFNFKDRTIAFNGININIKNVSITPTDRISFLLELINIKGLTEEGNELGQNIKVNEHGIYQLQHYSEQVLIDELKIPINFVLINKKEPFIISLLAWNKEAGIFKNRILVDPMDTKIVKSYKTGDKTEISNDDLYEILTSMLNSTQQANIKH